MGAISGLLTLGSTNTGVIYNNSDEWVSEYQDTILVRNARGLNAGTSLFGLMAKLKNEPTETTEFKWFERDPVTRIVYNAQAAGTAGTVGVSGTAGDSAVMYVDDGAAVASSKGVDGLVQVGSILKAQSGELLQVTAITTASASNGSGGYRTVLAVTRGVGDGAASSCPAIADNDKIVIVTLGKSEGGSPTTPVYEAPTTMLNYIQTFNSSIYLTNAFKASKLRTDIEGPLRERRVQALERVARDIELAYFFGRRFKTQGASGYSYYTGGIVSSIGQIGTSPAQSLTTSSGSCTLATFNDWLASFLTLGSDAKLAFAGPKAYSAISNFANSASTGFRITGQETVFGMNITEINTPFGVLSLAMHPLFKEISEYNSTMVVVDLAMIVQKVMEPLFLEPNIQTPGEDSYKEQFRAKYGLKLKFPQAFGYAADLKTITLA
jgi:hypothetical protein